MCGTWLVHSLTKEEEEEEEGEENNGEAPQFQSKCSSKHVAAHCCYRWGVMIDWLGEGEGRREGKGGLRGRRVGSDLDHRHHHKHHFPQFLINLQEEEEEEGKRRGREGGE